MIKLKLYSGINMIVNPSDVLGCEAADVDSEFTVLHMVNKDDILIGEDNDTVRCKLEGLYAN